jgi:hypothetical protein
VPGEQGDPGTQGDPGATGATGPPGANGADGAPGESAYQVWLDQGNTGDEQDFLDSLQGIQGVQGLPGEQGDPGSTGAPGTPGTQGIQGIPGEQGNPGIQGEPGEKGDPGVGIKYIDDVATYADLPTDDLTEGDAYFVNADGLLYVYGATGFPDEADGIKFQGPQGIQGVQGLQGVQGQPGLQGIQGIPGEQGDPGEKGEPGDSARTFSATCDTAAATVNKAVTVNSSGYVPAQGDMLSIYFSQGHNNNNTTLTINGQTYSTMFLNSGITTANVPYTGGAVQLVFTFDGTRFNLLAPTNTVINYANMTVEEGEAGTGTTGRLLRADYLKQIIQYFANQAATTPVVTTSGTSNAWTATVPGITELVEGQRLIIIPSTTSYTTTTLNVNDLGAAYIVVPKNYNNGSSAPAYTGYLQYGSPTELVYLGGSWVAVDMCDVDLAYVRGELGVAQGGTGATTLPAGKVLVGNGTGAVTGLAIDATPATGSGNLVTSGAVYEIAVNQGAFV